jgi:hypothetical protein
MADLIEALHNLARERARGGPSPLVAVRRIPARPGARISHLGISQRLSQAWVALTGEPFRPHQSLALAALRRGEPLALAGGLAARQSLHLLALELLRAEAPATAILVAPDEQAAAAHRDELERLVRALGEPLRVGLAQGADARAATLAHLVVATPRALHERLLRHHDRAWSALWPRLRLVMVADAHGYGGVAATHLAWLILRARRLGGAEQLPQLLATLGPATGAEEALAQISGEPWRALAADDGPAPAAALALWRPAGERAREAAALALGLARAGARVHLVCDPLEVRHVHGLVGADVESVSVGTSPLPAHAQVLVGLQAAALYLRQSLDGAQLTALLLGDDPAERTVARLAARDPERLPIVDDAPPAWVASPGNAYVTAQHLICAAAERPLSAEEVDAWGVEALVARLEEHRQLVRLPDPAWQPLPDGGDVYAAFDLRSASGAPAVVRDDQGAPLDTLPVAAFDRWGFPGAALPPLRGGLRVVGRDEGGLELTVRPGEPRRTLPLRRCAVQVRDRRERRTVRGREVGWGRVVLDEEVYGYRELAGANAPAERALNPALSSSLAAPACWVDLPAPISAGGQLAGWCLVAALPLGTMSAMADLVPAYDAEAGRVYFVDAHPGGNGVSAWLFANLEALLPCAYDIALDCRGDPLLEPVARADTDWLLALLAGERPAEGQRSAIPAPPQQVRPGPAPAPRAEPLQPPPEPRRREEAPAARAEQRREPASAPWAAPPPSRPEPREVPLARVEPPSRVRAEPPVAEPPRREAAPAPRVELPPAQAEPPFPAPPARAEPPPEPPRREVAPVRAEPPPSEVEPPRREAEPPFPAPPARAEPPSSQVEPPRRELPPAQAEPPVAEAPRREAAPPPRAEPRPPARKEPSRRETAPAPQAPARKQSPRGRAARPEREPAARPAPPSASPDPGPAQPPLPLEPTPTPAPPPARFEPPSEAPLPDAAAMVARLRRLREQRERSEPAARPGPSPHDEPEAEPRFHRGDQIVCTPYGRGEVLDSRVEGQRELLTVAFADHGELTIDAAVNAARLDDHDAPPADDDF